MPGGDVVEGPQRFFVSYAEVDVGWAEWVAWTLEAEGHHALIRAWDFAAGAHFIEEIHRALTGGRRTVAVLSDAYLTSAFATEEWQSVLAADLVGAKRQLLVVRVQDCDRPGLLRQIVSVDLFGVERDVARQRLLAAIAPARAKPDTEPEFPTRAAGPDAIESSALTPRLDVSDPGTRSAYLEQVQQIAPPRLVDREAEVAHLIEFCAAPDGATGSPYLWWRAAAWTGKSALLSSFVLDPPPEARVVSFFITARYAGNSDRAAFVEVVTEQLAEFLGEEVPPFLEPSRRERLWIKLFADAAALCQARGQRLVLVVDGLDEDRGVTGPGARSVAGLLPGNPPHGARIVVAGRPDPPIPADVPAHHPLRDPAIIRVLHRSAHATAIGADMQADLHRLRTGSPLERDLLGLVSAATGGLSSRDLEELSADPDVTAWDIEQVLFTVAGRSFASRAAQWTSRESQRVYLLGHEELQQEALRAYGPRRLAAYRDRLHAWAQIYRQRRWPQPTPEYLLRGYYRLLLTTGDLTRAVDCATDQARHDRMLDLTGGDTAALAEITDAQNAILAQPTPDLALMARLAVHRQHIADRNNYLPSRLPELWARLGRATRAEHLAHGVTSSISQAYALVKVAGVFARAGDHARARQAARDAEQAARAINGRSAPGVLAEVAGVFAQAGDHTRAQHLARDAEQAARTVTRPESRAWALVSVARALAQAGDHTRALHLARDAEQAARSVTDPNGQVQALEGVAEVFARIGEHAQALQVATTAARVARAITDQDPDLALAAAAGALAHAGAHAHAEEIGHTIFYSYYQARALQDLAGALVRAGELEHAEQVARRIADPGGAQVQEMAVRALVDVARGLAKAGQQADACRVAGDAEKVARAIADPHAQAWTLVDVGSVLVQLDEHAQAEQIAHDAEQIARLPADPNDQDRALEHVTRALAHCGDVRHAEQVAYIIVEPSALAGALTAVAGALSHAGEHAHARRVAHDAEQAAEAISEPLIQALVLIGVADALAQAGEHTRAEQVARAIYGPRSAEALVRVAGALARAGERERAEQVARTITSSRVRAEALANVVDALKQAGELGHAERVARTIADPNGQVQALAKVAGALAQAGDEAHAAQLAGDAERVAEFLGDPDDRARALADAAGALAQTGKYERARHVTREAVHVADSIPDSDARSHALVIVAGALLRTSDLRHAEQVARTISDPNAQVRALVRVAVAFARAGEHAHARQVAQDAEQVTDAITVPYSHALALVGVAEALTRIGEKDRAEQVARAITEPNVQAEALVAVATALAKGDDRPRAARLLAAALSVGDWNRLQLSAVADLNSETIRAIADAAVSYRTG